MKTKIYEMEWYEEDCQITDEAIEMLRARVDHHAKAAHTERRMMTDAALNYICDKATFYIRSAAQIRRQRNLNKED